MIDSSVFIEAWDERGVAADCKLILDGAEKEVFLGHVSTIILGEIFKKLLKLKKEVTEKNRYRYDEIHNNVVKSLMHFRLLHICEGTIEALSGINVRGKEKSQDKLNMACAIKNNCNMFIIKDMEFTVSPKIKPTTLIQITDKQSKKLRDLLNEIKSLQSLNG